MKHLKLLVVFAFAVTMSLSMTGCGGDDSSEGGNGGGGTVMTESEQKEYIDVTGRELVNKINADDFKPITELATFVDENLTRTTTNRSSKTDAIEDFFEAAVDMCTLENTKEHIRRLFMMSKFSAEFSYRDGVWVKTGTPNNTLRFIFNDKNGQPCVAEAVGSGSEVEVHASVFDDKHRRYDYTYYSSYTLIEENRFMVPEQVNVKLTRGNSVLVNIQVNINVSGGEFKYNAGNASVSMDANIVGYRIALNRAYYNGGSNAGVDVAVSKGGESLVKATVSANVRIDEDGEFLSAGNGKVDVDILGKVQAKGTIDDFNKIRDLDKQIDRESTEAEVKNVADQMNKQFNIGVYFNNNGKRQAYLQAYPFLKKKSYYERWEIQPVVCFGDGTSYSTFESLGDDSRFKELVKKVESLVTKFEDLVKK